MISIFLLKLLLSFLVGGSYVAFTIWVSEKFGSKLGGLLIGLPTTLLVSLLFIAWTQNSQAAVSSIPVVPATIGLASIFLATFIYQFKHGKVFAYSSAVIVWLLITFSFVLFSLKNIFLSIILGIIFIALALYLLNNFPHRKLTSYKSSINEFLFRCLFAGSIITLAVFLGKLLGPLWGGVFASFPVAFSSSLLLLERKHGIEFTSSVAKTMPYGNLANILFATAFYFLVPAIGIVIGTIIAYSLSLVFAVFVNKYILNRKKDYLIK